MNAGVGPGRACAARTSIGVAPARRRTPVENRLLVDKRPEELRQVFAQVVVEQLQRARAKASAGMS